MTRSAARLDGRLLAALRRIDDGERPLAETHRRLGTIADELGLPRPSYERVRLLLHELRRRDPGPGIGDVLLDITLRNRPPEAIVEALSDRPHQAL